MAVMELLQELDEIDAELDALNERLADGPRRLEESSHALQDLKSRIDDLKARENELAREAQTLEIDVQKHEAEAEKHIAHQRQTKSNEEYQVFKERVDQEKETISQLEEDALLKLEEQDALRSERGGLIEELKKAEAGHEELEAEVKRVGEELKAKVSELEAGRKEVASKVEPEDLDIYERVRRSRPGRALAPVKGSVCGACFVSLPPQLINLALMGRGISQCISCHRILYVEDAEEVLRASKER